MYSEANASEELLQKLPAQNVQPLWTVMKAMVTPTPSPKAEVTLWKYKELRPLLLEAGQAVSSEQAERRVLMLINPALSEILCAQKVTGNPCADPGILDRSSLHH